MGRPTLLALYCLTRSLFFVNHSSSSKGTSLWPAKQLVHRFHIETSRLRDEEEYEQNRNGKERSKYEISAAANVGDHVWDASGDHEIHQPVSRGAERNADASNAQGKDLRAVDPGYAGPGEAEADCINVDQGAGGVATRRDVC